MKISTAAGTKGSILGRTKNPIRIVLNPHRQGECQIWVIQKCLVTDVSNYDVLLGAAATYRPRLGVDPYKEIVFYRPKWEVGQYQEVATIPLEMIRGRGELAMGVYSAKEEHEKESGEEDASSSGECSDTWKAAFDEEQRALRGKPKQVNYQPQQLCSSYGNDDVLGGKGIDLTPIVFDVGQNGVTVLELFSGIGSGYKHCLRLASRSSATCNVRRIRKLE